MSSNTFLFKALAAQFDGGRRAHPPKRNTPAVPVFREREIRGDVPEGVKEGAEQRMKGTEGKQERGGGRRERKSRVEVEPKLSAAVPCHISAEHDSRTVWCGNGFRLLFPEYKTRRRCAF